MRGGGNLSHVCLLTYVMVKRTSENLGTLHTRCNFLAKVEFTRYIPRTMSYIITCSVDNKHILKFYYSPILIIVVRINEGKLYNYLLLSLK